RTAATGKTAAGKNKRRTSRRWLRPLLVGVVVVAVLSGAWLVYRTNTNPTTASGGGSGEHPSGLPYAVGQPGPGQAAPDFTLASTTGGRQTRTAYQGKTVLLYFQE